MTQPAHTALLLAARKTLAATPSLSLLEALKTVKAPREMLQGAVNACEAVQPGAIDLRGAAAAAVVVLARNPRAAFEVSRLADDLEGRASLAEDEEDGRALAFAAVVLEGQVTARGAGGFRGLARALAALLRIAGSYQSRDLSKALVHEAGAVYLALLTCLTAWREEHGCLPWSQGNFARPEVQACAAAQSTMVALAVRLIDLADQVDPRFALQLRMAS